ncbi:transmembrane protein 45A isoform X1 [Selaginella moellendorffii]|uniref:transmembrane protein 45A isoform X1 n=1 Tax=Selaginella moellendorffii TaxID=88036 RepID=UPI000D1C6FBF|nr:transmembrane protein 45A isoform X1 [Selaginella moellendorffii]|eukprot:XP_002989452.2 transmembrane protein 45A isoform X1 [Selaginella moellendorffii]
MGIGLPSHIDQGLLFGSLGLWHLSNTLVSFAKSPNAFKRRTWFPLPIPSLPAALRCLELWILLLAVLIFLATQISHITADLRRGHIPSAHLQRLQHITFGMFFLAYTITGLASEISGRLPLPDGALHGIFALGFLMELFVFHLGHHPGDTLESFVHMLMQVVLAGLVLAMVLEIAHPYSFLASTVRCMLLALKGSWFFHIGLLLNYPRFLPLGCGAHPGGGFPVCASADLLRAKSIQVLVFGWHALGILVATIAGYAFLVGFHGGGVAMERYQRLGSRPGVLHTIEELEIQSEEVATPAPRSLSRRRSYKEGPDAKRKKESSHPSGSPVWASTDVMQTYV